MNHAIEMMIEQINYMQHQLTAMNEQLKEMKKENDGASYVMEKKIRYTAKELKHTEEVVDELVNLTYGLA